MALQCKPFDVKKAWVTWENFCVTFFVLGGHGKMEQFNILDFIDSEDIREHNKDTLFSPTQKGDQCCTKR